MQDQDQTIRRVHKVFAANSFRHWRRLARGTLKLRSVKGSTNNRYHVPLSLEGYQREARWSVARMSSPRPLDHSTFLL